jgi:hypothetical protein
VDAARLADALATSKSMEIKQLHAELREMERDEAFRVLRTLLNHPDRVVRDWVSYAGPPILGTAAIPLLEALLNDADIDVQTEAMDALVGLDASYVERFVARWFTLARASDPIALYGVARLTQYRVPGAAELFRELAQGAAMSVVRNHARVLLLVLEGNESALLAGLRADDHRLMSIWVKGAVYLQTKRTLDALVEISQGDSHPECRQRAAQALSVEGTVAPIGRN